MNYSDKIDKLVKYSENKYNITINLYCFSLPDNISGQCDYQKREIRINESSAEEAFNTLLHEIGHWISYTKFFWIPQQIIPTKIRENLADYYGNKLRRKLFI